MYLLSTLLFQPKIANKRTTSERHLVQITKLTSLSMKTTCELGEVLPVIQMMYSLKKQWANYQLLRTQNVSSSAAGALFQNITHFHIQRSE